MNETPLNVVCPYCDTANSSAAPLRCAECGKPLFDGKPLTPTADQFLAQVNGNDIPVLVFFSAPWCNPCKIMSPIFDHAAAELEPGMRLVKINIEEQESLAGEYAIQSIPTVVLYKGGWEVGRIAGAMDLGRLLDWVRSTTSKLR